MERTKTFGGRHRSDCSGHQVGQLMSFWMLWTGGAYYSVIPSDCLPPREPLGLATSSLSRGLLCFRCASSHNPDFFYVVVVVDDFFESPVASKCIVISSHLVAYSKMISK